ncbi:hypothetical protein [Wolbachia endosymbiont of Tetranychus urticae]|uniref:hypothetical protein n=1 Tax=Wolbachia endosymbiont of Tetranychus urticae TaxID=169184 RepID=UPI003978873F
MNIDEIITELKRKIETDGNNEGSEINKLKSLLKGPPGPQGSPGKNVDPEDVVKQILFNSPHIRVLSESVATSGDLASEVADRLKHDRKIREDVERALKYDIHFQQAVKGPKGDPGLKGQDAKPEDVAKNIIDDSNKLNTLKTEVASKLKSDNEFQTLARGPKGDPGPQGLKGDPGPKGEDSKPEDVAKNIIDDSNKRSTLKTEVASKLKSDNEFQGLAKGPKGDPGLKGQDAKPEDVAKNIIDDSNKLNTLKTEVASKLKSDNEFQTLARGPKGDPGLKGQDAKPEDVAKNIIDDSNKLNTLKTEVASKLKSDNEFQTLARGPKGDPGPQGLKGDPGPKGEDSKPEDVAKNIIDDSNKRSTLKTEVASKLKSDNEFQGLAKGPKGDPGLKGQDAKPEDVAKNIIDDSNKLNTLKTEVASKLKSDNEFQTLARGPKGDPGPQGLKGDPGPKGEDSKPEDVAKNIIDDSNKRSTLKTEVASKLKSDNEFQGLAKGPKGDPGLKGQDAKPEDVAKNIIDDSNKLNTLKTEVASKLKSDNEFQTLARGPKGDPGPQGLKGDPGPKGEDSKPEDVAKNIIDDSNKRSTLKTEVASKLKSDNEFQGLAKGPKGDPGLKGQDAKPEDVAKNIIDDSNKLNTLKTEVASKLKSDNEFQTLARGPKGDPGPQGLKGDPGPKGEDSKPEDVAKNIIDDSNKRSTLKTEVASKLKSDNEFQGLAKGPKGDPGLKGQDAKPEDVAKNIIDDSNKLNTLKTEVASKLKSDNEFQTLARGPKGDPGPQGLKGDPGPKGEDSKPEDVAKNIIDDSNKRSTLKTEVASKLKSDNEFQGLAKGPKGDPGLKGQDAKPEDVAKNIIDDSNKLNTLKTEVASKLKSDNEFQTLARGPKGDPGPQGLKGDPGPKGEDSKPEDVAKNIIDDSNKRSTLKTEVASKLKSDNEFQGLAKGPKGDPGLKGQDAKPEDVAKNIIDDSNKLNTLKTEVASKLKSDNEFQTLARGPKGDPGPQGLKGDPGPKGEDSKPEDVAKNIIDDSNKRSTLKTEVASKLKSDNEFQGLAKGPKGDPGLKGQDAKPEDVAKNIIDDSNKLNTLKTEVASKLKSDNEFQTLARGPKGDPGPQGLKGDPGPKGEDSKPEDVAKNIIDDSNKRSTLKTEVASKLKSDNTFKQDVGNVLKNDSFPVNSIDPDKIDQSLLKILSNDSYESKISDNLANIINNNEENRETVLRKLQNQNVNMSLKIIKGESYGEISSAKIVDSQNNDIGTFANIGYFFQNGDLHIRNHITETNIKVPKEFHFLRTVYDREGRLKLALCNSLGNLLSEYKKYDPEYRELPKFVEMNHLSLERGEVLKYCYDWRPIFHLKDKTTGGKVDVFKVQQGEKKIGTLIDEFIFYKDNRLHYKNNSDLVEECCYSENLYTGFDNKLSISDINNITINLEQSLNWNL